MSQPTPNSAMTEPQIVMYTTTWCGDCRRSKRWLNDHHIAYREINIDQDAQSVDVVRQLNRGYETVPTIVFPDGAVLAEPSNRRLALQVEASLGITTEDAVAARN